MEPTDVRLCDLCHKPLPADAHGSRLYHEKCEAAVQRARVRANYRRNAELRRAQRKARYRQSKLAVDVEAAG
jgi:hypothetical protein